MSSLEYTHGRDFPVGFGGVGKYADAGAGSGISARRWTAAAFAVANAAARNITERILAMKM